MGRRVKTFTVESEGRDKGKQFLLTEMPARKAENWALRAVLALAKGGADLPDDWGSAGWADIARLGIKSLAGLPLDAATELLDEMMTCVKVIPDPSKPHVTRPLVEGDDGDIEEVQTLIEMRQEIFFLHVGFSMDALKSKWTSAVAASRDSLSMSTSQDR